MKNISNISLTFLLLICLTGCVSTNATHGQANGGFLETEPQLGRIVVGYGSVSFMHADIVPGQGVKFTSSQYELSGGVIGSGNLLYTESMEVTALTSGTVRIIKEQKPLLEVPFFRIDNPFSNPITSIEFIPLLSSSTNNIGNKYEY